MAWRGLRAVRPVLGSLGAGALAVPLPLWADGQRQREGRFSPVLNEGLNTKAFAQLTCVRNEFHTHDTRKITLQLPEGESKWTSSDVPITNVLISGMFQAEGSEPKKVVKPYNPLALGEAGSLTLLVKRYAGGRVGGKLHELKVGETIDVKGGSQQWSYEPGKYTHYAMVAAGTGITPLMQACVTILDSESGAKVTVLCSNKTPEDALLLGELAELQKAHPGSLTVHHHIDAQAGSQLTPALLQQVLPAAAPGVLVLVCGPQGFLKAVAGPKAKDRTQGEVQGFLKELGYSEEHVYKV